MSAPTGPAARGGGHAHNAANAPQNLGAAASPVADVAIAAPPSRSQMLPGGANLLPVPPRGARRRQHGGMAYAPVKVCERSSITLPRYVGL